MQVNNKISSSRVKLSRLSISYDDIHGFRTYFSQLVHFHLCDVFSLSLFLYLTKRTCSLARRVLHNPLLF